MVDHILKRFTEDGPNLFFACRRERGDAGEGAKALTLYRVQLLGSERGDDVLLDRKCIRRQTGL
jgi:hypothetical protein